MIHDYHPLILPSLFSTSFCLETVFWCGRRTGKIFYVRVFVSPRSPCAHIVVEQKNRLHQPLTLHSKSTTHQQMSGHDQGRMAVENQKAVSVIFQYQKNSQRFILGQFVDLKGKSMRQQHDIGAKKQNKATVQGGRQGCIAGVLSSQDHIFKDTCRPRRCL